MSRGRLEADRILRQRQGRIVRPRPDVGEEKDLAGREPKRVPDAASEAGRLARRAWATDESAQSRLRRGTVSQALRRGGRIAAEGGEDGGGDDEEVGGVAEFDGRGDQAESGPAWGGGPRALFRVVGHLPDQGRGSPGALGLA